MVDGKSCHLPVELKHRAWWAIRILNYDLTTTGEERRVQLSELEKIRSEAYGSARLSKETAKLVYNRMILRKDFPSCMKVVLYDSRLHLFLGMLRSHRTGPFVVTHVFPYGTVEIPHPTTRGEKS